VDYKRSTTVGGLTLTTSVLPGLLKLRHTIRGDELSLRRLARTMTSKGVAHREENGALVVEARAVTDNRPVLYLMLRVVGRAA